MPTRTEHDGTHNPSRPAEYGVWLHDPRHIFATIALDAGHDYREASEWPGHADDYACRCEPAPRSHPFRPPNVAERAAESGLPSRASAGSRASTACGGV